MGSRPGSPRESRRAPLAGRPPVLRSIDEIVDIVNRSSRPVYVRFAADPPQPNDPSVDHETGLTLPGLSVNPLHVPRWWNGRSVEEWVVRRVCTYAHLQADNPDRSCWLVHGQVVDHGPDNEPLIVPEGPIALIAREVVDECMARRIAAGLEPADGKTPPPWQATT